MRAPQTFYVYMLTNRSGTLYVRITRVLLRRLQQHRADTGGAFTARYALTRHVYVESTTQAHAAIAREKQLKGWTRARKVALIASVNPGWLDLAPS